MATPSPAAIVVVTGGARGLGFSIAGALAASGADVALLDVLDTVQDSAAELAKTHGVRAVGVHADVTDQRAVDDAFATVTDQLGVPNLLVTAAGITVWNDSVDVSAEEWRRVVGVNLDGTFFAAAAFGRGLLAAEAPGAAVLVSSMSGLIINVPQNQASYSATKAAVSQLARSLAVEWAAAGIRVNAIAPGYFLSDMTRQFTEANADLAAEWTSRIPLGRMGEPEDLHGLVRYLTSPESAYMTGQTLVIDGGYTLI